MRESVREKERERERARVREKEERERERNGARIVGVRMKKLTCGPSHLYPPLVTFRLI
jgi:hypothetical protein